MADPEEYKEELAIFVQSLDVSEERLASDLRNPTPLELMCTMSLRNLARKFHKFDLSDVNGKT